VDKLLWDRSEEEDEDDPSELEQVIEEALRLALEDASRAPATVPALATLALPIEVADWRQWSPLAARSSDSTSSDIVSFSFPTVGSFLQAGEGFSSVFRATPSPRGKRNCSSPVPSFDAPALSPRSPRRNMPSQVLNHSPGTTTLSPTSSSSLPQMSPSSLTSLPEEEQTLFEFELQSDENTPKSAYDLRGDEYSFPALESLPTHHHLVRSSSSACVLLSW
jgi:hypothetical protein